MPARDLGGLLIRASSVGVHRGGRWIIHDVNLEIRPGEVVTVVGPNGAGKSTLLKTLLGLYRPDAGNVVRVPGLQIGYVPPTDPVQFDLPLTVRRLMTLTSSCSADTIANALREAGVDHLSGSQVCELSHGEFQRVMLARALSRNPDLLVMDEPLRGIDFSSEAELYQLISEVVEHRGCAALMTSHDLHYVMSRTDRVVCLNRTIRCMGAPEDTVDHPEFHQLFGTRAEAYRHVRHQCHGESPDA